MRYGFTKPSKPHSSKVRQVQEYNAVQNNPARIDPSSESTPVKADSALRVNVLGLVSTPKGTCLRQPETRNVTQKPKSLC